MTQSSHCAAARRRIAAVFAAAFLASSGLGAEETLRLAWEKNILTIEGDRIPGGKVSIWYLEAYCRPGSTDREWQETVIGHETKLHSQKDDGSEIRLRCALKDGVVVDHTIRSTSDAVDFLIEARNPTEKASLAHWAQPCIRVGDFTGTAEPEPPYAYVEKSFVFLDGKLARMPTPDWATKARYVPGQVWAAPGVDRDDVNPRPLNPRTPSNGLIGCFSADGKTILAVAFEPYQELFQGVIRCLHSDFRLGGLEPAERKTVRGKLCIVPADVPALLERYEKDFAAEKKEPAKGESAR